MLRRNFITSRRSILAGLAASVAQGALAQEASLIAPKTSARPLARGEEGVARPRPAPPPLPDLAEVIAAAGLSGQFSCVVADAITGEVLESYQPTLALPPASVAKSLTTLYALDSLGPGYRFKTRVLATGPTVEGIIQGDIVLAGGGDPTLEADGLATLVAKLSQAGIEGVTGRLILVDAALPRLRHIDSDQPDHVGYNPAISGLNLNFNRVFFEWKRDSDGYDIVMEARAEGVRPSVDMARMRVVDRSVPIYTYTALGGRDDWTVAKGALGKGGGRWLPVRNPTRYAGEVFRTLARDKGITLPAPQEGDMPASARVLAERSSADLRRILKDMLKYSTNLTAETVGLSASQARGLAVTSLTESSAAMNQFLASRYGMDGAALVDHSGLGEDSRVTSFAMATGLARAGHQGPLPDLMKPVTPRDENGKAVSNSRVRIQAKTGTLNFASALAGYISAPGEREMTFAIFSANLEERAKIPKEDRERPEGSRAWNARSRRLQRKLLTRWAKLPLDTRESRDTAEALDNAVAPEPANTANTAISPGTPGTASIAAE